VAGVDADRARDVVVVLEAVVAVVAVLVDADVVAAGVPSARAAQPDRSGPTARNVARATGTSAVALSAHHRMR
jgi:hypothetical protein